MKLRHGQAVVLMVAVTLMWSIAGVITRHLEQARSFEVTFWRSAFTVLALLILLPAIRGRATLVRSLRDLKLAERNGAFELNGQPVVKVRIEGALLKLDVAKRPSRSPDWEHADAGDHARLRRFIDDVKKRVARWNEGRDAD